MTMADIHRNGITNPNQNDVLSGRGKAVNNHAGNKKFRETVQGLRDSYYATCKTERPLFAKMLVNEIRNLQPSGRFLKQDPVTKLWFGIDDSKAWEKTRQAFREGGVSGIARKPKNTRQPTSVEPSPRGRSSPTMKLASSKQLRPVLGHQIQTEGLCRDRNTMNFKISPTMGSTSSKELRPILRPEIQIDDLNRNAENLLKQSVLNERLYNNLSNSNTDSTQQSLCPNQCTSIAGELRDKKNPHFPHSMAHEAEQHVSLKANTTYKETDAIDVTSILQLETQILPSIVDEDDANLRSLDAHFTPLPYEWKTDHPPSNPRFDQDQFNNKGKINLKSDRIYSDGQCKIEALNSSLINMTNPSNTAGLSTASGISFGTTVLGSRHPVIKTNIFRPPEEGYDMDIDAHNSSLYHGEGLERIVKKEHSDLNDDIVHSSSTSLGSSSHDICRKALHSRFDRRDSEVVTKMEDILALIADEASYNDDDDDMSLDSSIWLAENKNGVMVVDEDWIRKTLW